jgi:ubiquitin-conjugating enzyme E2 Z
MTDFVLSRDTIKRLAKDVKDLIKNPLTSNGIHYIHDETNILKGYALITGPVDTPYAYGNYIFELNYPANYPQSPPKVIYHTNDGIIRFNPNLYRNGKVCLSILNTWRGELWTPCNTISSILLTICTTLNNNPFLNEPHIKPTHDEIPVYNKILKYGNFAVAICDVLEKPLYRNAFPELVKIAEKNYIKNFDNIKTELEKNKKYNMERLEMYFYKITIILNYTKTEDRLDKLLNRLK